MDYPGVTNKRGRCQITFNYLGERYRPTLTGFVYSRAEDRKSAARLLATVQREIQLRTFYFPAHFPTHPAARRFLKGHQITVEQAIKLWLANKRTSVEPTTYRGYEKDSVYHLIPQFGQRRMSDLTTAEVEDWLNDLDNCGKTKNNILIPLRAVFREALRNEQIDRDPISKIPNFSHRSGEPDPLERVELEALLAASEGQIQNIIEFAVWSGLRTSELIALRWRHVDLAAKRFRVCVTRTAQGEKNYGKTDSSVRDVDLHPQAIAALNRQLAFTERKDHVFENPRTGEPWKHDGPYRKTCWNPTVARAGIRHRPAYQTRHTFASMLLSAGVEPMYVAKQMGHKDWGMIRKTYGRWLPEFSKAQHTKIEHLWAPQRHQNHA